MLNLQLQKTISLFLQDPLEQFDVLKVVSLGNFSLTNLSLLMGLNVLIMIV